MGGLSCVRPTLRNRPREGRMAVPMVSSAKGVTFRSFQRRIASFRVASVALCDMSTCFMRCQKSFCVQGQYFCEVLRRCVAFYRGRSSTLETSDVILRGRRNTLDVSCCVFSANRIVNAARSGDKVQIPWQALAFCDM